MGGYEIGLKKKALFMSVPETGGPEVWLKSVVPLSPFIVPNGAVRLQVRLTGTLHLLGI